MKILLDTNSFIWASCEPKRLSEAAQNAILDGTNDCFLSLASLWEMQIKCSLGKLPLPGPIDLVARAWTQALAAEILPIRLTHIGALDRLPPVHRDPFDRMIAAQAATEDMVVLSSDGVFRHYPVTVIW